ncbi:proteinase-activated receptor 2-like [Brienomyrus brachyistius]|uniref:proteinase-activated receptor 2-like n=1 Tax=Brienomyrus brachyistius TaxID=42636 RepID=UPI0020B3D218|nr:proteinase-activated receptor 2-like [Brienomyrus brachyistius]
MIIRDQSPSFCNVCPLTRVPFSDSKHQVIHLPTLRRRMYTSKQLLQVTLLLWTHFSVAKKGFRSFEGQPAGNLTSVSDQAVVILTSKLTTVFLPVVYIIVFAVGLPTNAMAIWVFIFRTKKKHPAAIFMANLALSDLLFVIWIPLKISYHLKGNNWVYGEELCKVLVGFFYGNMYCSVMFITCISVQRYFAVVYPLSVHTKNSQIGFAVSITVWVVIWLVTIPLYVYDQAVELNNPRITTCHDVTKLQDTMIASGFFLSMGIFAFAIPTVVCTVAYVLMVQALRNSTTLENIKKKRRKSVCLIVVILVIFLVCFAPSNIMLLIHYGLRLKGQESNTYGFYISTLCLASLNSCLDPFIYYFISEEFRNHVKNTLVCRSVRTVERMRVSFSPLKNSNKSNTDTSGSAHTQSSSS